jgi:hypothetical protein
MEGPSDVPLQDPPPDENEPIGTSFTLVQHWCRNCKSY